MQLSSLISFCTYPPGVSKNKRLSLPTDFFSKLMYFEEKFHHQQLDIQSLDSLIQSYKKLVEIYNNLKDPIESYFSEKIQFILSRPSIIKLIHNTNPQQVQALCREFNDVKKQENQFINQSMSIDSSLNLGQKTPSFPSFKNSETDIDCLRKRQLERSVQVKIQVELEHNQNDQVCGLKEIFKNYEMQQIRIDEEIAKQTEELNNKLKQRLQSSDRKGKRELKKQGHSSPILPTQPFDGNEKIEIPQEKITLTSQFIINPNFNEIRQSISTKQNNIVNIQNTQSHNQ